MTLNSSSSSSNATAGGELTYDVVKIHHDHSWLRQQRVLQITWTHILKCNPGDPPQVTKKHSILSLRTVAMRSATSFMLQFDEDHPYFYKSPRAPEILNIIKSRHACLRAAECLAATDHDRELLQKMLQRGEFDLADNNPDDDVFLPAVQIVRAFRSDALDGRDAIDALVSSLSSYSPTEDSATSLQELQRVRAKIEELRESFVTQIMGEGERSVMARFKSFVRNRQLPVIEDRSVASAAAEEAVEKIVLDSSAFDKIWSICATTVTTDQLAFDNKCARFRDPDVPFSHFGVTDQFQSIEFDLVLHHLRKLQSCRTAAAICSMLAIAVKSVIVSIRAHYLRLRMAASQAQQQTMVPPRPVPALVCEVSEEAELPSPCRAAPPSPTLLDDAGSFSPVPLPSEVEIPQADKFSTDDVLPVFILILVHSQVRNLVTLRQVVQQLGDPDEPSERMYYFTLFSSAIQWVLDADEYEPPSGQQELLSPDGDSSANMSSGLTSPSKSFSPFSKRIASGVS